MCVCLFMKFCAWISRKKNCYVAMGGLLQWFLSNKHCFLTNDDLNWHNSKNSFLNWSIFYLRLKITSSHNAESQMKFKRPHNDTFLTSKVAVLRFNLVSHVSISLSYTMYEYDITFFFFPVNKDRNSLWS